MDRFSLKARWVVPVEGEPISGGVVTVDNGLIADLGNDTAAGDVVEDLGDVVLLPGLVNAHTHLEFSDLAQPLGQPGMPLPEWIRLVINERKQSAAGAKANITKGLQESLHWGVTTLGEIATADCAYPSGSPEVIDFQEVIGFSAGRVESALTEVLGRIEAANSAGVSPHAPYTVHPQLMEKLVLAASERQMPMAMHLAESREELELLGLGTGGFRDLLSDRSMWDDTAIPRHTKPLDYLKALSRAPRSLVVHGNYLSRDEQEFLASHADRMSLVYCPRTHAFFEHESYPLEELLDLGVQVALGTDSRASSPDLSLLGEMNTIASRSSISPQQIVRMATLTGAAALGCDDRVGSVRRGKVANLVALPCSVGDPCEAIVGCQDAPRHVWLHGQKMF